MDLKYKLYSYLEDYKDDIETGLTMKKIMGRAGSFKEENGMLYFSVERHRGVLGAQYIKGAGMNAFVTIEIEYCFDPEENRIFEVDSRRIAHEVNYLCLAEEHLQDYGLSIEPLDNGKYLLDIICSSIKSEVSSLKEVFEIVKNDIDSWEFEHFHDDLELVTEKEKQEFDKELREAYYYRCREMIEEEWENATDCE